MSYDGVHGDLHFLKAGDIAQIIQRFVTAAQHSIRLYSCHSDDGKIQTSSSQFGLYCKLKDLHSAKGCET